MTYHNRTDDTSYEKTLHRY